MDSRLTGWVCSALGVVCLLTGPLLGTVCSGSQESSAKDSGGEQEIEFVRDIRPIFQKHCWECHGPDVQESGYRLDRREDALQGGDNHGPNLLPGDGSGSNLIRFVSGQVAGLEMPPDGPRLDDQEIALLRRWIDQGAKWPVEAEALSKSELDWWSLRPLIEPPLPAGHGIASGSNPIDLFLEAQLRAVGIQAVPPADRRTLIRRVYFDLWGLPPSPQEVAEFVSDDDPAAYTRLVDRLLAGPHYGERWARHWMDLAHFAETHGHDQDRIREHAWPYRDYLITRFNQDLPYGRFVQEQVAGDVLFPHDPLSTVALGFLAAGPWDESSLRDIREDTLDRQIGRYLDRDDVLSNVMNNFASTTIQCARCHHHKFDPISQSDYYALQAVFSGVERANRVFDADPQVHQRRQHLLARRRELEAEQRSGDFRALTSEESLDLANWESEIMVARGQWQSQHPVAVSASDGTVLEVQDDDSIWAGGLAPERDSYTLEFEPAAGVYTALRLELLVDDRLPQRGPGRQDNGNLHLSEVEFSVVSSPLRQWPIRAVTADFEQTDWAVSRIIDGNPQTAWGIYPAVGQPHAAILEFAEPLRLSGAERVRLVLKQLHGGRHVIGRFRMGLTSAPPRRVRFHSPELEAALAQPTGGRSLEQWQQLDWHRRRSALEAEIEELPDPQWIYAAAADFEADGGLHPPPGPRPVFVLRRGDIQSPMEEAQAGSLSCIAGLESRFQLADPLTESSRRAALAEWLSSPENPLTWRSIVNRTWQFHFGRGLVATTNDFGRMGQTPSHPELLDWLACQFRDGGQSLKDLNRRIVLSAAYQRSSLAGLNRAAEERDPENRWLWRMNRSRLDAEAIRDAVLAVSGQLDRRMGGPSDRQFELQPGSHVTPRVDYSRFDLDSPAARRRSVYRFLFRTLPDPYMEALDCPAGDSITPIRENSVTVQQALAMWNDAFMIRAAQDFANRLQAASPDPEARIRLAYELCLARGPQADEVRELNDFARQYGWENFCRILLNLNEFTFVD